MLNFVLKFIINIVLLLLSVAFLTLLERKVMAGMQRRKGPNILGFYGILQPFADAIKLILKEFIVPGVSNSLIFLFSPFFMFICSLMGWIVIPFTKFNILIDLDLGILYLFMISSMGVYSKIMAGWSSNSKYAFLGSIRSVAQMISYEISIGLICVIIIIIVNSFNLSWIVEFQFNCWFIFSFFPIFILFFISMLAETNRAPFDLPEAEAELVSGYNVEYGSIGFVIFFMSEYLNIILMSSFVVILFLGGWLPCLDLSNLWISYFFWFGIKVCFILFFFIWIRATLPRYRYDQLMFLGWKVLLPLALGFFFFYLCLYYYYF